MKARIYVAENDLSKLHIASRAKIRVSSVFSAFEGTVTAIAPTTATMEPGVMEKEKYIGLHAPHYYFVNITVLNRNGVLKIGMTGEAKVLVRHRSLAGLASETVKDFVLRKLW